MELLQHLYFVLTPRNFDSFCWLNSYKVSNSRNQHDETKVINSLLLKIKKKFDGYFCPIEENCPIDRNLVKGDEIVPYDDYLPFHQKNLTRIVDKNERTFRPSEDMDNDGFVIDDQDANDEDDYDEDDNYGERFLIGCNPDYKPKPI